MTNNTDIKPALTPDEWADATERGGLSVSGSYYLIERAPHGLTIGYTPEYGSFFDADDLPRLAALANAALPDDDPRKITREDVEALWFAFGTIRDNREAEPIGVVARKLAALLPPE